MSFSHSGDGQFEDGGGVVVPSSHAVAVAVVLVRVGNVRAVVRGVWPTVPVGVDRSRRTSAGGERQYVYERVSTRSCLVGLHAYHDAPRRSVHVKRVELGSTTVGYVLRFGEGAVDAYPKRGGATRLSSTGQ